MNIYNVTVCRFTDLENHGNVIRLIVDEYVKHTCVIDFKNNIAIDIKTKEQFYILKKDKNNRILSNEITEINSTESYGVEVEQINIKSLPKIERLKLFLDYTKFSLLTIQDGKQKLIKR